MGTAIAAAAPLIGVANIKCKAAPPFAEVDQDRNGYLDRQEARAVHGLTRLFKLIDTDRNQGIDIREYGYLGPPPVIPLTRRDERWLPCSGGGC